MQQLELKDPAAFASEFLRQTQLQGFGALSKRDLELLVFVLLERDGAIDRNASNHAAAAQLRVTPAKLRALRRDGYARWRQLVAEPADEALRRILGQRPDRGQPACGQQPCQRTQPQGGLPRGAHRASG